MACMGRFAHCTLAVGRAADETFFTIIIGTPHTHLEQSRQTTTNEKQQRRTHTLVGNDLSSNNKSHRLLIRGTLISDVLRGYKRRWEAGGGRDRPIPSRSQGAHRGARVVIL